MKSWRTQAVVLAALLAITTLLPTAATTQQVCRPRENTKQLLKNNYDETVVAIGLVSNGMGFLEIYGSEKGSWTITITNTRLVSCVVMSGTDLQIRQGDLEDLISHLVPTQRKGEQ